MDPGFRTRNVQTISGRRPEAIGCVLVILSLQDLEEEHPSTEDMAPEL